MCKPGTLLLPQPQASRSALSPPWTCSRQRGAWWSTNATCAPAWHCCCTLMASRTGQQSTPGVQLRSHFTLWHRVHIGICVLVADSNCTAWCLQSQGGVLLLQLLPLVSQRSKSRDHTQGGMCTTTQQRCPLHQEEHLLAKARAAQLLPAWRGLHRGGLAACAAALRLQHRLRAAAAGMGGVAAACARVARPCWSYLVRARGKARLTCCTACLHPAADLCFFSKC